MAREEVPGEHLLTYNQRRRKIIEDQAALQFSKSSIQDMAPDYDWSEEEMDIYNQANVQLNKALFPSIKMMVSSYILENYPDELPKPEEFELPYEVYDEIRLKKLTILISVFAPGLKDERLGITSQLPSCYDSCSDNIVDLMVNPSQYLQTSGFWRKGTNRLASDMVRAAIMQNIRKEKTAFSHWESVYYKDLGENRNKNIDYLYKHINDMSDLMAKRLTSASKVSVASASATRWKNIKNTTGGIAVTSALVSISAGVHAAATSGPAAGAAVGVGVTAAASMMLVSGGVAAIAVCAVAAAVYFYKKYKKKKKYAALDNLLEQSQGKDKYDITGVFSELQEAVDSVVHDDKIGKRKVIMPDELLKKSEDGEYDIDDFSSTIINAVTAGR